VHRTRRISADSALRLARNFGTTERFWMNLQGHYDLEIVRDRLAGALDQIRPLASA
jgi:addiction module HigA family antidote